MNGNAWMRRLRLPMVMALFVAAMLVFASPALAVFFGPVAGPGIASVGVAPTSISVSISDPTIKMGESTIALATTFPVGSNPQVTWLSSDESIATVDRFTGVVTPVSIGRAAIVATSVDFSGGAVSGSSMVEVEVTPVTSIEARWNDGMDSAEITLAKGDSMGAYVTSLLPADATDTSYTWWSGNRDIATVDESGNVTAVSNGWVRIFASANDGTYTAGWVDLIVYTPVSDVTIRYGEGSGIWAIYDSQLAYPYAVVYPADATTQGVTWSWSSSYYENFATIDPTTGVITPIPGSFNGSVHLHPTATVVGGGRDGADVTDSNWGCIDIYQTYITDISVNLSDYEIAMGETSQASAGVYPENASFRTFEWSSSDESVVTVDAEGLITTVGPGWANVTATATDGSGISAYQPIEVQPILIESINLSWDGEEIGGWAKLWKGDGRQISYINIAPENATYQTLNWVSTDEGVAVVDENGNVTAVGNGTCGIIAYTTDGSGLWGYVGVSVSTPVESVYVYGDSEWGEIALSDSETAYARATVYPNDAWAQDVTWSFLSEWDYEYASIDPTTGLITPVPGTINGWAHLHAVATVEGGGRDGEDVWGYNCVDIYQTMVEYINVSLDAGTIRVGDMTNAYATVGPEEATDKSYSWYSSDESVATVDAEGLVTAVAGGTADIIASANDGSGVSGFATVMVLEDVTSIEISADTTMERGDSQTATAEVLRATATDRSITWMSSDNEVVQVDPTTGEITAVGKGGAYLIAVANDSSQVYDSIYIEVVASVTDLNVTLTDYDITVRDTAYAMAATTPEDPSDGSVTWASSDEGVATVAPSGVVTPQGVGQADIIATAQDGSGVSDYATITVSPILAESIRVSIDDSDIGVSESAQASVTFDPTDVTDSSVVWSSSDESVATVDESGYVTALKAGSTVISATTQDGSELTDGVEVYVHNILVESVGVGVEPSSIPVGGTGQAFTKIYPKMATDRSVSWTSGDPSVATVDPETGMVTGVSAGEVRIFANANDESRVAGYAWVTITADAAVDSISVELEPSEVVVGEHSQATATVLPLDAWTQQVIWSSSDESIATVDEGGDITTHAAGEVTITATTSGYDVSGVSVAGPAPIQVFGSAVLTVNPLPPVLVESLAVSVADNTLSAGQASQASAAILPANAADKTVKWMSSDDAIATVDDAGLVTAVAEGQVTITASANDGSGVADSETITVYAAPVEMSIATPWLSVTSPGVNTKFYIRSTMAPAHNAGTAAVYAKIQRKRADGTWSSVQSVRMGAYYSTADRSILRSITSLSSRGSYRVRLSYTGAPAYVTAWKTFTVR